MIISYLTAVSWLMLCELVQDFILDIEPNTGNDEDLFIIFFGLEQISLKENIVIATYFAFTSLSTVGFGDYHPRGDIERIGCAIILLFGVAIFSYIMSTFIEILGIFKLFQEDLSYEKELSSFFGVL